MLNRDQPVLNRHPYGVAPEATRRVDIPRYEHPEALVAAQADAARYARSGADGAAVLDYLRERISHHDRLIRDEESQRVVYVAEMPDGSIKVGSTNDLARRMAEIGADRVIASTPGGYRMERALHRRLKPWRVSGLETYRPCPAVDAVIAEVKERP